MNWMSAEPPAPSARSHAVPIPPHAPPGAARRPAAHNRTPTSRRDDHVRMGRAIDVQRQCPHREQAASICCRSAGWIPVGKMLPASATSSPDRTPAPVAGRAPSGRHGQPCVAPKRGRLELGPCVSVLAGGIPAVYAVRGSRLACRRARRRFGLGVSDDFSAMAGSAMAAIACRAARCPRRAVLRPSLVSVTCRRDREFARTRERPRTRSSGHELSCAFRSAHASRATLPVSVARPGGGPFPNLKRPAGRNTREGTARDPGPATGKCRASLKQAARRPQGRARNDNWGLT